jgi:hypothetical protein
VPELQAPPLVPVPRAGDLPLSFGQQRLWFLDQLLPGSSAYNIAPAFSLKGPLNATALEQAFREIVRRHETLRTVFPTVDDQPVQRVMPPDFFGWKVVDLAAVAAAQSETEARRLADEEAQLPFEIAKGPLLRVTLLRIAPENHLLLMTMPHIVSDGWSLAVFCEELSALYGAFCAGRPSPLPELPIQFADYAVWKRNWLQGKVLEEQLGYWKQQLAGVPTKIELPSDHPRPPVQTLRGARYFLNLPTTLSEATAALGREEKTTLFMTLLAAFNTFLYTYTGQTDLLIGSPFANRTRIETQGLIGPLVNTLVLRTQLSGNPICSAACGRWSWELMRIRAILSRKSSPSCGRPGIPAAIRSFKSTSAL